MRSAYQEGMSRRASRCSRPRCEDCATECRSAENSASGQSADQSPRSTLSLLTTVVGLLVSLPGLDLTGRDGTRRRAWKFCCSEQIQSRFSTDVALRPEPPGDPPCGGLSVSPGRSSRLRAPLTLLVWGMDDAVYCAVYGIRTNTDLSNG